MGTDGRPGRLVRYSFATGCRAVRVRRDCRGWLDAGDRTDPSRRGSPAEGWCACRLSRGLGGQGGGLVELALVAEELGRDAAPSSAWMGSVLAVPALHARRERPRAAMADCEFAERRSDACWPSMPSATLAVPALRPTGRRRVRAHRVRRPGISVRTARAGWSCRSRGDDGPHSSVVDVGSAPFGPSRRQVLTDRTRTAATSRVRGACGTPDAADVGAVLDQVALRAAVLARPTALARRSGCWSWPSSTAKQRRQFGVADRLVPGGQARGGHDAGRGRVGPVDRLLRRRLRRQGTRTPRCMPRRRRPRSPPRPRGRRQRPDRARRDRLHLGARPPARATSGPS